MLKNRNSESGISIIELLVVLVVTAIVITAAVYQYGNSKNDLSRDKIALDFKTSLERARFDSIKRRATVESNMARVVIKSATSFALITDQNYDGTIDEAKEGRIVDFSNTTSQISNTGLIYPVTIRFDYRGYTTVEDKNEAAVAPRFKICNQNCTTETASNTSVITLSATGTVINGSGGYTVPNYANPTVSPVPSNKKINSDMKIDSNVVY